jgi:hypothetical protein
LKATLASVPVVWAPKTPPAAVMSPVTNGALEWKVSSIVIVTASGGVATASGADANAAIDATANRRSSLRFICAPLPGVLLSYLTDTLQLW